MKKNTKKRNQKEERNKTIDRIIEVILIIIIILLLLHTCELQRKNGKSANGNVNIIEIKCDNKKCEKQKAPIDCLLNENSSRCIVPSFVGKTKMDVLKWLSSISNDIEVEYRLAKSDKMNGTVLEQSVAGISIKELIDSKNKLVITIADNGSLVNCTNNENNSKCIMPNFIGKTKNDVLKFLNAIENHVKVKYVYKNSSAKAGTIIDQSPAKGKKIKDIINNGETVIITISTGNNSEDNSGDNDKPNPDEGSDDEEITDEDFIVYDDKVTWSDSTNIKIFENPVYNYAEKIAPESSNAYKFILKNSTEYNLKYKMSFDETNPYNMNLKYKLKKNDTYVISNYVYYNELNLENQLLNSKSSDTFYLEWKWVSEDDTVDTAAGKAQANYKLSINIEAESIDA